MFKLIVLSAFVSLAAARPYLDNYETSLEYSTPLIRQQELVNYVRPIVAKVGAILDNIPAEFPQQNQYNDYHRSNLLAPIIARAIKTYIAPEIRRYAAHAYAASLDNEHYDQSW